MENNNEIQFKLTELKDNVESLQLIREQLVKMGNVADIFVSLSEKFDSRVSDSIMALASIENNCNTAIKDLTAELKVSN